MVVVVMVMVMVVKRQTAKTEILRPFRLQYKVILRHCLSDRAPQIVGADHALRALLDQFVHLGEGLRLHSRIGVDGFRS